MTTPKTAVVAAPYNAAAGKPPPLTDAPDPPRKLRVPRQSDNWIRAYVILGNYYHARPDAAVTAGCYLSADDDYDNIIGSPIPDCLVAFGMTRPKQEIDAANAYIISEIGKPPDFVLDVGSYATGRRDYTVKRAIYAAQQVREYWRFDHSGGLFHDAALAGDRLVSPGVYEPIPITQTPGGIYRGYSAALGLELHWCEGRLRFGNPVTRTYLPHWFDLHDLADAKAAERAARQDELAAVLAESDALAAQADAFAAQTAAIKAQRKAAAARYAAVERLRQLEAQLALPD